MYLNKYLKPGDFVTLLPVGVRMTLQYNNTGSLEKIYVGFDSDKRDLTENLMEPFITNNVVPTHISIKNGTAWVYGVLYTGQIPKSAGHLPECVEDELLDLFHENPKSFAFHAGYIKSTSTPILGAIQIRQYLKLARFNVLPGWFAPGYIDDTVPNSWLNDPAYTFRSVVSGLISIAGEHVEFISTNIKQWYITNTREGMDTYGSYHIYADVVLDSEESIEDTYIVRYLEASKLGITKGSIVYLDVDNNAFGCTTANTISYPMRKQCKYCGKIFDINPKDYQVRCPDEHCTSRLIPHLDYFVSILNLPYPDGGFSPYVDNKEVTCIPDLMLLDIYKDLKIDVDLTILLRAMIPLEVLPDCHTITDFVKSCNDNVDTILYYASHTTSIASDLQMSGVGLVRLKYWLEDDCNLSDLKTVLELPQINVIKPSKRFNGAPVFLGKTICITGKFIHGSHGDIIDIIESYSGKATTKFDSDTDLVLIGGTKEDISGAVINAARNICLPIWDEQPFFERFGIDEDLQKYLGR